MLPLSGTSRIAEHLLATPPLQVIGDVLVIGHLVALAIGVTTVLRTDFAICHRLTTPFRQADFVAVYRAHVSICWALLALWVTGFGLFLLRTGGDPTVASPKLVAKLLTVSWLSFTAFAMARYGLWNLGRCVGRPLIEASLSSRIVMAAIAGLSVAGWGAALLLGAASTAKSAEWAALSELLTFSYLGAGLFAVLCAIVAPVVVRIRIKPRKIAVSKPTQPDARADTVVEIHQKHAA